MENENIENGNQTAPGAPVTPPEPAEPVTEENPYDSIISEQREQISALMDANRQLTEQVTSLINSGAQITHEKAAPVEKTAKPVAQAGEFSNVYGGNRTPLSELNPPSLADDADWSLEGLAGDIGKM